MGALAREAVADRTGQLLGGSYELVRLVGKGGMGAVYEALHRPTSRRVAVKILHPEMSRDREAVRRFRQEAKSASAIRHPNIVEVLEMGEDAADGSPYLVQEFLVGNTLGERLRRQKRIALGEAIDVILELAGALGAAHARGIVHRDVKPENVFLCASNEGGRALTKIIDFGVSKMMPLQPLAGLTPQETTTGSAMGTPRYMSPEQLRAERNIDGRADVWAVGVVFYEMLAGRCPFDGKSVFALSEQILVGRPVRLDVCDPSIPADVAALVELALEPDRARRIGSMSELADGLARCRGRGANGSPLLTAKVVPTLLRRMGAWAAVASVVAVGALGVSHRVKATQPAQVKETRAVVVAQPAQVEPVVVPQTAREEPMADAAAAAVVREPAAVVEEPAAAPVPVVRGRSRKPRPAAAARAATPFLPVETDPAQPTAGPAPASSAPAAAAPASAAPAPVAPAAKPRSPAGKPVGKDVVFEPGEFLFEPP